MPTLHRLATLRDDVIFFVWVYQSYKYKVDYARVNEFGQGGDDEEGEGEGEGKDQASDKKEKNADEVSKKESSGKTSGSASSKATARKRK